MKAFILQQTALLRSYQIPSDTLKVISWFFSLMISAYLLIILAIPLYESSAHKGYVFATDNDGGRAIETSIATKWYNSNHFAPYGNLYFRFSHSLADLINLKTDDFTPSENKEKTHNFALKVVSLFSVFGLGLFLGLTLFEFTFVAPLFASFFTLVAIKMPMWSEWIFRPHPEHLLNVFIAIAVLNFARLLKNKDNQRLFILSAFAWGLAMAVKRSTSIFIPGILIMMLLPYNKASLIQTLKYIGYMLFAYLVVGFPQNFGFYKHIKFLLYESSLHSAGDWDSISMNLTLVGSQLCYLLPVVLIGAIFSFNKEKVFSHKFLIFVGLSFIPILMRKMSFIGDHHTMPLAIATLILALTIFLQYFPWRINSHLVLFILLVTGIKLIEVSPAFVGYKDKQIGCFHEYDQIMNKLEANTSLNHLFIREPFYPSNHHLKPYSLSYWGLDWNVVNKDVKYFGVTQEYIMYHLGTPPLSFYGKMLERWDDKNKFYNSINGQNFVTSPTGIKFKKVMSSKECDLELWERED